ncbi:MAG: hypothetical protein HC769_14265 [Cyanobacteria bacterium CRU_2_1]|nr:hypothetical protein [Cyanobacteria bacterium RU_5_0]NJR59893.1 hypothetical protein [Cyanobacteria bacterium CRU_2_1]
MTYRDQLYPWCIVRSMPNAPPVVVARFRRPNDADAQLKLLRRMAPEASFTILFDRSPRATDDSDDSKTSDHPSSEPQIEEPEA